MVQKKTERYFLTGPLLTAKDFIRNEKLVPMEKGTKDEVDTSFKMMAVMWNPTKLETIGGDVCHTVGDRDDDRLTIVFRDISYDCPICLGHVSIRSSLVFDCGHLMCSSCIIGKINAFPETKTRSELFQKCHFCRGT